MSVLTFTQTPRTFQLEEFSRPQTPIELRNDEAPVGYGSAPGGPSLAVISGLPPVPKLLLLEITVFECESLRHSIDRFIGLWLAGVANVTAVYRQRLGESFSFYTLMSNDDDEALDSLFEVEQRVYRRFPELEVEFHILAGVGCEGMLPSGSILVGRPS